LFGKRSRCQITLSGFPRVASDFSYSSPGREFHDLMVRQDHRPEFVERGPTDDGVVREGSATTMNDTNSVFDLGSSPTVTGRTAVPVGETESPVNPVSVAFLAEELSPPDAGPPMMTSICFSIVDPIGGRGFCPDGAVPRRPVDLG
ncbi:hypothetical protein BHE74_00004592, partial [Ensete ventricosum]